MTRPTITDQQSARLADEHEAFWETKEGRRIARFPPAGTVPLADLLAYAKAELRGALDHTEPFAPGNGRHLDSFHVGCCISRALSAIMLAQKGAGT